MYREKNRAPEGSVICPRQQSLSVAELMFQSFLYHSQSLTMFEFLPCVNLKKNSLHFQIGYWEHLYLRKTGIADLCFSDSMKINQSQSKNTFTHQVYRDSRCQASVLFQERGIVFSESFVDYCKKK